MLVRFQCICNMSVRLMVVIAITTLFAGVAPADLNTVLLSVPEDERVDFLKYHAERGYQLETSGKAKNYQMGLPDEFSMEVYNTLLKKSADNSNFGSVFACIVCWPNGKCVDLCDPGVHPL